MVRWMVKEKGCGGDSEVREAQERREAVIMTAEDAGKLQTDLACFSANLASRASVVNCLSFLEAPQSP